MKKILVTGCQGFIGSELVRQLIKHNKVIGIDDLSSSLINKDLKNKNFLFIKGRCQDPKIINKIKGKIDFIYHLAGQSSGEKSYNNTGEDLEKNTLTTVKLLEFALKKNVKDLSMQVPCVFMEILKLEKKMRNVNQLVFMVCQN